jgi:hypothetical protein
MKEAETMTETTEPKVNNARVWLFRLLVMVAAGVMLVSWFQPWWTIDIEALGKNMVQIRPWGLDMDERMGSFSVLVKGAEMPAWLAPFMWAYLVCCMLALAVGAWVRGKYVGLGKFRMKLAQFLIAGVGLSYIIAGIVAAGYASIKLKAGMNIPLQGHVFIDLGDPFITYVDTRLLPGYYLIFVAGLLCLVLALLYDKIIGEPKRGA